MTAAALGFDFERGRLDRNSHPPLRTAHGITNKTTKKHEFALSNTDLLPRDAVAGQPLGVPAPATTRAHTSRPNRSVPSK